MVEVFPTVYPPTFKSLPTIVSLLLSLHPLMLTFDLTKPYITTETLTHGPLELYASFDNEEYMWLILTFSFLTIRVNWVWEELLITWAQMLDQEPSPSRMMDTLLPVCIYLFWIMYLHFLYCFLGRYIISSFPFIVEDGCFFVSIDGEKKDQMTESGAASIKTGISYSSTCHSTYPVCFFILSIFISVFIFYLYIFMNKISVILNLICCVTIEPTHLQRC